MSLNREDIIGKSLIIKKVNTQLDELLKFAFADYVSLSNSLGNFYNKLKDFYNENGAFVDRKKIEALLASLNQIIVDLQFHDIIRQKLEHIALVNDQMIREVGSEIKFSETKYFRIYPKISKLHQAQLVFISKEYRDHSLNIKHVLTKGVSKGVASLENFVFDFSETFNHINRFSDTIQHMINALEVLSKEVVDHVDEFEVLSDIKKGYSMQSEREVFNQVFDIDEEFEDHDDIELF